MILHAYFFIADVYFCLIRELSLWTMWLPQLLLAMEHNCCVSQALLCTPFAWWWPNLLLREEMLSRYQIYHIIHVIFNSSIGVFYISAHWLLPFVLRLWPLISAWNYATYHESFLPLLNRRYPLLNLFFPLKSEDRALYIVMAGCISP